MNGGVVGLLYPGRWKSNMKGKRLGWGRVGAGVMSPFWSGKEARWRAGVEKVSSG